MKRSKRKRLHRAQNERAVLWQFTDNGRELMDELEEEPIVWLHLAVSEAEVLRELVKAQLDGMIRAGADELDYIPHVLADLADNIEHWINEARSGKAVGPVELERRQREFFGEQQG